MFVLGLLAVFVEHGECCYLLGEGSLEEGETVGFLGVCGGLFVVFSFSLVAASTTFMALALVAFASMMIILLMNYHLGCIASWISSLGSKCWSCRKRRWRAFSRDNTLKKALILFIDKRRRSFDSCQCFLSCLLSLGFLGLCFCKVF